MYIEHHISSLTGICRCDHPTSSLKTRHDSGFGYRNRLLFHCFMDGCSITFVHFVKFINPDTPWWSGLLFSIHKLEYKRLTISQHAYIHTISFVRSSNESSYEIMIWLPYSSLPAEWNLVSRALKYLLVLGGHGIFVSGKAVSWLDRLARAFVTAPYPSIVRPFNPAICCCCWRLRVFSYRASCENGKVIVNYAPSYLVGK